ncbi:chaperone modulator CbpM [Neptunicella marina]|uniref:Chaperone modulatory protein CbpM n=1 Tax=Neptunicella marina TaxID=2125989 RepID=A0A8J6IPQ6_9ALTE|nr:chaperone modulator CbpM [Neptunicella marina]MBC3764449.1 chaperone modulatory protein CbpM [Neptunicella marina]
MAETTIEISVTELYAVEYITPKLVTEAVDLGIVIPIEGASAKDWVFDTNSAHWLKKAARLYLDLEIDWVAVCMVIDLLKQKEQLLRENAQLRAQLQRFI